MTSRSPDTEVFETDEAQTLARLLRAIANGEDAKSNKHDIIFGAAANLIEGLVLVQRSHERIILRLHSSLTEMVEIFWGEDGDGIKPPPICIQRAQAALGAD